MTTKRWFAVDVVVLAEAAGAIEEALAMMADLGTSRDSLRKSPNEPVYVTGFFSDAPDIAGVSFQINSMLTLAGLPTESCVNVTTRKVEDADWLAEWKRHWRPVEIGRFVVSPPWIEPQAADKLLIRIEPNMAFGTGTHETTQLCLETISEHYTAHQSMLDVGTGTGILAIAAAKLGGMIITACDTDADSIKIARENAALNAVHGRIHFYDGSIDAGTPPADLVCANLTADVILPILPLMLQKAKRYLLLSGILAEQENLITEAISAISDMRFEIRRKGEWLSVIVFSPAF
jgi:ribosomal protein L11 methyltransferase